MDLLEWMQSNGVENPHSVPSDLKEEFGILFGDEVIFWPQEGGQTAFQNCTADIMLYGGKAGAGKSFSILMDNIKWIHLSEYRSAVFRKRSKDLTDPGGLWDEAKKIFPKFGCKMVASPHLIGRFDSGAEVTFMHCNVSDIVEHCQGIQAATMYLDELTHFSKKDFVTIIGRNRSTTGIKSYVRATCNPDAFSWVREFIEWWIGEDGYIIKERAGVIRYFIHYKNKFHWDDTAEGLIKQFHPDGVKPDKFPKPMSFTFIPGELEDNKKLLEKDPDYISRVCVGDEQDVQAMAHGNWNPLENPDSLFSLANFNKHRVEYVDLKNIEKIGVGVDPSGSVGRDQVGIVMAAKHKSGHIYVLEDKTGGYMPDEWAEIVCNQWDKNCLNFIIAEANFGGRMVQSTIEMRRRLMTNAPISDIRPELVNASQGKKVRAEPIAGLYKDGFIHHVGYGLSELEREMVMFSDDTTKSPNRLDALVWIVTKLMQGDSRVPRIRTF